MHKRNTNTEIDVYLERRKSRDSVGTLIRSKLDGRVQFEFTYEDRYLLKKNAIPLGPEFPLTKSKFTSKRLFPTFEDRIPSQKNPAYEEYCRSEGISPDEDDPMILLGTIGRRGPSSFMFESRIVETPSIGEIAAFRKNLGLSIRQFAVVFDTSTASVQKLELGKGSGRELLKRLNIYLKFPEVARYEIERNKARLHSSKFQEIMQHLAKPKSKK